MCCLSLLCSVCLRRSSGILTQRLCCCPFYMFLAFSHGFFLPSPLLSSACYFFFAQKNPSDAASYFSRRMAMMKEQLDKAYGVLNQKRQLFEAVSHLLQNKLENAQAAQAQAGAQPTG